MKKKFNKTPFKIIDQFLNGMAKYFRLEIEGIENVPQRGPAIIAANHSGFSGLDAMILSHEVHKKVRRKVGVLTHYFWFLTPLTGVPAQKLGFIEANMDNGLHILDKNQLMIIFPEAEHGNFKPSNKAYELQEFKRGFIRMALLAQAPIVPVLIIGAEETHITLKQFNLPKMLRGLVLPLPMNILPLPARWKFKFLDPIDLPYKPEAASDHDLVKELAEEIQEKMQKVLNSELKKRKSVYF